MSVHPSGLVIAERPSLFVGTVIVELRGPDGRLKGYCKTHNLITAYGNRVYAERGSGATSPQAAPTGMKLGTGTTAPSGTGAGSALVTYSADSHLAFDSGYPTSAANGPAWRMTYRCTYVPGKATTASALTEVVIVNEALTNATSATGATVSRALLTGVGSKNAPDSLTVNWTHDLQGT